jgi:hypothetical protein
MYNFLMIILTHAKPLYYQKIKVPHQMTLHSEKNEYENFSPQSFLFNSTC